MVGGYSVGWRQWRTRRRQWRAGTIESGGSGGQRQWKAQAVESEGCGGRKLWRL